MERSRLFVPPPQSLLQFDQASQSVHLQCTGHGFRPQAKVSDGEPWHSMPPLAACTFCVRLLFLMPPPHDTVHVDHRVQSFHAQFTRHACVLQSRSSVKGGGHLSSFFLCDCLPPAQDAEHADHSVQSQFIVVVVVVVFVVVVVVVVTVDVVVVVTAVATGAGVVLAAVTGAGGAAAGGGGGGAGFAGSGGGAGVCAGGEGGCGGNGGGGGRGGVAGDGAAGGGDGVFASEGVAGVGEGVAAVASVVALLVGAGAAAPLAWMSSRGSTPPEADISTSSPAAVASSCRRSARMMAPLPDKGRRALSASPVNNVDASPALCGARAALPPRCAPSALQQSMTRATKRNNSIVELFALRSSESHPK